MTEKHVNEFSPLLREFGAVHAYCRSGNRSSNLFKASKESKEKSPVSMLPENSYDVVIVGAGSGGIAAASSLLKRSPSLTITMIDPADHHYYQPGWTMVGAGVFDAQSTQRTMASVVPNAVKLLKQSVQKFNPEENSVTLDNGLSISYKQLIVCPGLTLNWQAIEGLEETLGKNGVTSNYRYDLAPYTWELVQNLKQGKAIFTQPPMPIKCAGAPQKALYLSADYWFKQGLINAVNIDFCNAGGVLFGVPDYVPALMAYMEKYRTNLKFSHNLIKVDGKNKMAWFSAKDEQGNDIIVESGFDMLHVCPPQCSPEFIRNSSLSDRAGWLDVDPNSLQHKRYQNIWGMGDVMNTTNAKTMAAARKQAPVVAKNIIKSLEQQPATASYLGYGSCPLTVERGKIVLAEFSYGGKVTPTFPKWVNDGTQATRFAWTLKVNLLPTLYWQGMLKGRELLATSE